MPSAFSLNPRQKNKILLEIVAELIRNSGGYIYRLEEFAKEEERQIKDFAKRKHETLTELVHKKEIAEGGKILQQQMPVLRTPEKKQNFIANPITNERLVQRFEHSLGTTQVKQEKFRAPLRSTKLTVPEERLPAHLEYLKPVPAGDDIDLGSLNPLIKDPQVQVIECAGPDANITVSGSMGTKPTGIMFNRDEISNIIDRFSIASKIPVNEGVFRVVVGRLIFLAIVSEIIGSRFTIKKMFAGVPVRK